MNAENRRKIAALEANAERYGRLAASNPQFREKQQNVLRNIERIYRNARMRNLAPIRRGSVQETVETLTPTPSPKANNSSPYEGGLRKGQRKTQRKRRSAHKQKRTRRS